jgi:hypothetical protein
MESGIWTYKKYTRSNFIFVHVHKNSLLYTKKESNFTGRLKIGFRMKYFLNGAKADKLLISVTFISKYILEMVVYLNG